MNKKQAIPTLVLTLGLMGPAQAGLNESDIQAAVSLMEQTRQQTGVDKALTHSSTAGGHYVSPFKANGELAGWVQSAAVPVVRRSFGPRSRHVVRQPASLKERLGGWGRIRAESDVSFQTVDELAAYMHSQYAGHPDYAQALAATLELYPELEHRYLVAIKNAAKSRNEEPTRITRAESVDSRPTPAAADLSPEPLAKTTSLDDMTAPVTAGLSELTAPVELQVARAEKGQGLQMLTQNVDLGREPSSRLMAEADTKTAIGSKAATVAEAHPVEAEPEQPVIGEDPYAEEIERIMRPVRLAQAQQFEELRQPANVEEGSQKLTVEQRLEALKQRRASGELTGDEYLAERRRIIYG